MITGWNVPIFNFYTDGACSGNPGPGGWGLYGVLPDGKELKLFKHWNKTTNQQMELEAAANALRIADELSKEHTSNVIINIYTDSAYLCNGMNAKWYLNWLKNGWKNSKKEPVANKEQWEEILLHYNTIINKSHIINFVKVAGHSDNLGNIQADVLACRGRDGRED
jgi:ribonuclease HI